MTTPAVAKALDDALDGLMRSEAPLADRLDQYARILREQNQPFAEAVDRLVNRLAAVGAGASVPMVDERMPTFLLPDDLGHLHSLEVLLQSGPLIVAFRRGHWCPYCLLSTKALAKVQTAASRKGANLIVISPEREAFSAELKRRSGVGFPILSDIDNGYALSIGLAISLGDEMRDVMTRRGRDLSAYHGNDAWILPIPATFVLDRDGTIIMRHVDPDYRRRASIDEILSAIPGGAP